MPTPRPNRSYYDAFASTYDRRRDRGYHAMLDDLEAGLVLRHARGGRLLEAGCGTGLVLQRLGPHFGSVMGVDLSGQMLRHARTRGLPVAQSDLVALPFPDGWFDVVCCFKVLPHVERVREALAELGRVVRPGGLLVAEFYNPRSIRGLLWRVKTPGHVGHGINEREVYVRFDTPAQARAHLPGGFRVVAARGARVVTVLPQAHRVPVVGPALALVERLLADPLAAWGSFYNVVARKE